MRRTEAPTGSSRHQEQGHKGKEAKGGQGFTRVCTHAHHHPHQTQRTPERDRKKKKKKPKRLFDCVTQALGCGMWDLVP